MAADLRSAADQAGPLADLSQPPPTGWVRQAASTGIDQARAVAVDGADNVFIAGYFTTSINFGGGALSGAGGKDIYLAKYASDGTLIWGKRFGGAGDDLPWGLATDSGGNVYVAGEIEGGVDLGGGALGNAGLSDMFVAKYSPSGAHLWSKRFGGLGYDQARSVTVDASGNVLVTGTFMNSVGFGGGMLTSAGMYDVVLAKYSSDGSFIFAKRFGGTGNDMSEHLATDGAGNILLSGSFTGMASFGGATLVDQGNGDLFIAKYDQAGAHVFSKGFGGISNDSGEGVVADSSGNIFLTGIFANTVDFGGGPLNSPSSADIFLVKFNPSGAHLWSKRFGGNNTDAGISVAVDKSDNLILGGSFGGSVDFGGGAQNGGNFSSAYLAKYASDGTHMWSQGYSSTGFGFSAINCVAIDSKSFVFAAGYFSANMDLGSRTLTSTDTDTFLLKRLP